jgi:hypothetical protein
MNSTELLTKMTELFETLTLEHSKTSKAAHGRARKAAGELKKLVTEYRKASTAEDKAGK